MMVDVFGQVSCSIVDYVTAVTYSLLNYLSFLACKGKGTLGGTMAYLWWLSPCLITWWFVAFLGKDTSCYCPGPGFQNFRVCSTEGKHTCTHTPTHIYALWHPKDLGWFMGTHLSLHHTHTHRNTHTHTRWSCLIGSLPNSSEQSCLIEITS